MFPGTLLGYEVVARRIWKGDILIANLEKLDASEIYPRRINAKVILIRQKDDEFIFPFPDGTAKMLGRDHEFGEPTLRREQTVRSEDLSGELQSEPGESQLTESTDDAEALAVFWSIQGDFICRHHNQPRVQLYVPKEETFPIQLKNIDVIRSTLADLDVLQEKRIDDYGNVDSNRHLSNSWTGFTRFTLLKEKTLHKDIGKDSNDNQTDHVWPEVWTNIGKAAQNRKKTVLWRLRGI